MQYLTHFETWHFLFGEGKAKIISAVVNSFMHHTDGMRIAGSRLLIIDTYHTHYLVGGEISIFERH